MSVFFYTFMALINDITQNNTVSLYCCFFFTSDAGLLASSQYSEDPATGHLDTGFSWFSCA